MPVSETAVERVWIHTHAMSLLPRFYDQERLLETLLKGKVGNMTNGNRAVRMAEKKCANELPVSKCEAA